MCISPKFGGLLDSDKMAKAKILVVGDEAITAMDIQNRLKELDYDVPAIAASGEGAIKRVEEIEPDLVLMDIVLKGDMNGIDAAEEIHDRFDVPVVYITAYQDEELLEKTKVSEPYGYITKPFEDKELRPVIEMALQRHRLEKALRESESQYRSIFDSATDSFLIFDTDGNIVEANIQACKMYGYPYEELIKLSGKDIVHRDYCHLFEQFKRDVQRTGEFHAEAVDVRKDGTTFDIEVRGTLFNYKYKPHLLAVIRDITERKKADATLSESEIRFRELFDNMSSGVAVYEAKEGGTDFVFKDFNHAAEKIDHIKKEDLIGKSVLELFPGVMDFGLFAVFQRVWNTGKPEHLPISFYKDERIVGWRENYVYKLPAGEIVAVYADVTARKKAEEALRESEEKYRTLVESINDIVFTLDRAGKFTYLSPGFEVDIGYLPEDLIGHSFTEVLAPEYIESTVDIFRRGLSGETIPLYDVELLLRDGRRLPIELNVSSILDAEGQPIARLGVARDISERKKMEDELQRSEALYRTIFEATSAPTVILDEDGTFYRVNAEGARISGFTKEELEGKKSWTEFIAKKEDLEMMKGIHRLRITDSDKVSSNYEFLFKDRFGNCRNIYVTAAGIPGTKRSVVSFMDITERKRGVEALRESEEKYRTFIERTSEGYWSLNLEHKTVEVNQALCDMLGYTRAEIMGKSPHDFVDEENLKIFKYHMGKIESTLHRSYEIVLKTKSGEDVFTRFNATTIIDDTGEFKGAYSLVTNITEQKKAEEALRESNAKIRSITASAHDAVIMVDDEETISYWNEAAERIFGYTEEDMIGTKLHGAIIPERFREAAVTGFKSFRETGQGAAVGKTLELAANRKDGTELPVELSLSAVKLKDKWNAIGVIRDISERKKDEKALKESEERFRTIFDSAVDGILLVDLDTRRFYMANNAICQMLGYTVGELTNMGPADIILKEDLPWVMKELERVVGEAISEGSDIPMKRKDGSVIHTNINGARIEFAGTKYLLAIIRDVTELKKKTEALRRFNKLAVGRELRMIELKKELNALLEDLGKEPRYKIAGV
uniref:Protein-glutamate methylesterase/protein-glutamine glutaminase n=1 Tax=Candidatus Methanophaga sp. ANME-1 ERB7 TaxID=2759913 RepID=A0A7G9Z4X3_9EURY|nr:protein-glutamate methylesterase/protein-glutamine glutaminase [Methanosarcinales archaeon ANME-1 ERB7]